MPASMHDVCLPVYCWQSYYTRNCNPLNTQNHQPRSGNMLVQSSIPWRSLPFHHQLVAGPVLTASHQQLASSVAAYPYVYIFLYALYLQELIQRLEVRNTSPAAVTLKCFNTLRRSQFVRSVSAHTGTVVSSAALSLQQQQHVRVYSTKGKHQLTAFPSPLWSAALYASLMCLMPP
jgi:hypothetical protein